MKKLLLLAVVAVLTSCITPYESDVPLSRKGDTSPDTLLLGYWKTVTYGDDTTVHVIKITPVDEYKVHVDYVAAEDEPIWETGWSSYLAHQTVINEETYTNLKVLDGEGVVTDDCYYVAKYRLENDSLFVYLLTNDFKPHFDKRKDFRKFIKKNQLEVDSLFEEFLRLKKVKE